MTDAANDKPQAQTADAKLEQKRKRAAAAREFLGRLAERYPSCFTRDADKVRPLAVGTQQKLRAELAEAAEWKDVSPGWLVRQALGIYTRSPDYLGALVEKRLRINLDGSDAGEVTELEQQHAQARLDEIAARRAEWRPARPQPPRRPRKPGPSRNPREPQARQSPAQPVQPTEPAPRREPRESAEARTARKLEELAAKFSRR